MKYAFLAMIAFISMFAITDVAQAQSKPAVIVTEDGSTILYKGKCNGSITEHCGKHTSQDATTSLTLFNRTGNTLHITAMVLGIPNYSNTVLLPQDLGPNQTVTITANDPTPGRALATMWCAVGYPVVTFDQYGYPMWWCELRA